MEDRSAIKSDKARERAVSCKTLICFLQSLVDEVCDLELKNDLQLTGRIVSVDCGMNVELEDVTLRRPKTISLKAYTVEQYDYLYLKGEKIRYVQFSDQIDVRRNIESKLNEYHRKGRQVIQNRDVHHKQRKYDQQQAKLLKYDGHEM